MSIPYNETESFNLIVAQEIEERKKEFILERIKGNSTIFSSEEFSANYTKKIKIINNKIVFTSFQYVIFLSIMAIAFLSGSIALLLNPEISNGSKLFIVLVLIS